MPTPLKPPLTYTLQAFVNLIAGMIIGFVVCWQLALVTCAVVPALVGAGILNTKFMFGLEKKVCLPCVHFFLHKTLCSQHRWAAPQVPGPPLGLLKVLAYGVHGRHRMRSKENHLEEKLSDQAQA